MKNLIIILFLLMGANIHAAQMGLAGYVAVTGNDISIDTSPVIEATSRAAGIIPDLKGAYELSDTTVFFSNGSSITKENSTFSGTMSLTSTLAFQSFTVNGNSVNLGSSYTITDNTMVFINVGSPKTSASYTWDGTYLITYLNSSTLTETDTWKRVEDLSTKTATPSVSSSATYSNGLLHIPSVAVPYGIGGTVSYDAQLELVPFKEPQIFELKKAEKL